MLWLHLVVLLHTKTMSERTIRTIHTNKIIAQTRTPHHHVWVFGARSFLLSRSCHSCIYVLVCVFVCVHSRSVLYIYIDVFTALRYVSKCRLFAYIFFTYYSCFSCVFHFGVCVFFLFVKLFFLICAVWVALAFCVVLVSLRRFPTNEKKEFHGYCVNVMYFVFFFCCRFCCRCLFV